MKTKHGTPPGSPGPTQENRSHLPNRPDPLPPLEQSVADFLAALGLPRDHPDLARTPERVALAWREEFLAGYRQSPEEILTERFPAPDSGPVFLTGLSFVAICPHHLLPYWGVCHLAYAPAQEVVGLGKLSQLVNCYARRLVLQETLTAQIVDALMTLSGCRGAACMVVAFQTCLALRGEQQTQSRCTTIAHRGVFESDRDLHRLFLQTIALAAHPSSRHDDPT